jgi:hypothetical protein
VHTTLAERVTLRLAVSRQSVHLGAEPLEHHDQRFFATEPLPLLSSRNILSDEEMGFSYEYAWHLSSMHVAHIIYYWKFFPLHYIQVLCQYRLCKTDHVYLISICYSGSLDAWTVVSLTTAKFKSLIFSVSGFALSYTANMLILTILYDFCLSTAQFCYIIIYIWNVSHVQIADRYAPWKISSGAENLVMQALQF